MLKDYKELKEKVDLLVKKNIMLKNIKSYLILKIIV